MKKIFILITVLTFFSCKKNTNKKNSTVDNVKIIQEWFANANYAGEVVAQHKYDSISNINLKIIEGSYEIDPIKMVLTGDAQIGVAGADKVLIANDKGANLVVFGVVNPISPVCFISLKNKNINSVKDFNNKKIGVLTGTATEYVYRSLINKEKIETNELEEIEISFDLNTFLNNHYDVRPAFIFDEPVSLDFQNIKYNVLKPSDYDVNFIGTVYFCKREYLNNNPDLIHRITVTLIKGWEYALSNNEDAIKYLKKSFPQIDTKRELASLKKGITYFKGENNQQLYTSLEKWKIMAKELERLKVINKFDVKNIDYSFVKNYYNKNVKSK